MRTLNRQYYLGENNHHTRIIALSFRWCVCGRSGWVLPKTLKWVAVYSSVTFHIYGLHSDRSAPYLYTVMGWGAVPCVCGMTFLYDSTLYKVSLLQAGIVVMF